MIIDKSALLAVLLDEADADHFEHAIALAPACQMSVASYLEAIMVIEGRLGEAGGREIDNYLEDAGAELVSVTPEQVQVARLAWRRYGKGNHPAGLNFGDCFAYALAEVSEEPLLFKVEDFALTDVE